MHDGGRFRVCEARKWELSPLLTRRVPPSKHIGKTPWHLLCSSSIVPGLFGNFSPSGGPAAKREKYRLEGINSTISNQLAILVLPGDQLRKNIGYSF